MHGYIVIYYIHDMTNPYDSIYLSLVCVYLSVYTVMFYRCNIETSIRFIKGPTRGGSSDAVPTTSAASSSGAYKRLFRCF